MRGSRAEVAKRAGVSTATVSYVLNNKGNVSEETRQKVHHAIKELDYKPNLIARSLVTNETMQLGIVLNDIVNPFFGEIIMGFENAAIDHGYFVNVCTGYKNLDAYYDNFISRRIDGLFVAAISSKFHMEKIYNLVDAGIKVVISGNPQVDMKRVSSLETDCVGAMDQAVSYLVGLGHKDIAFVSGISRSLKFDSRLDGYLLAVKKFGLPCQDSLLIDGTAPYDTNVQDGYNLTRKLIASKKHFTAIIGTNDLMAIGAIKALNEAGYNVPEDVSVMGFDDIYLGTIWKPYLTTMSVSKTQIGQKAFEFLYSNIKHGNTGFYMSKYELLIRESTGLCRL